MLFTWCVSNLRSCPKGNNNGRNAQFHCFSSAVLIYVQSSHCYWLNASLQGSTSLSWATALRIPCDTEAGVRAGGSARLFSTVSQKHSQQCFGASGEAAVKYLAPSVVILICNQFQFRRRGTWADCAGAFKEPGRAGQRDQSGRGAGRMPTSNAVMAARPQKFGRVWRTTGKVSEVSLHSLGWRKGFTCDEVEVATHQVQIKGITLVQVQDSTPWGTAVQNIFPFNCRQLLLVLCWSLRYRYQSRNEVSVGNLSEKKMDQTKGEDCKCTFWNILIVLFVFSDCNTQIGVC